MVQLLSYGNGIQYLQGCGFWGLISMVLMARASTSTWLDSTALTKNPTRTLYWFLLGASIKAFVNVLRVNEHGYEKKTFNLHRRVAQNEHTHAILRNIGFHLQTRKMSVWDANPQ